MIEKVLIVTILILVFIIISLNRKILSISQIIKSIGEESCNGRVRMQNCNTSLNDLIKNTNKLLDEFQNVCKLNKEYEEERNKMITNMSHDLRTPLTSLLGYIEYMNENEDLSEEEKDEYMRIVEQKGNSLRKLVNEFFKLSKLEVGDIKLEIKKINLSEIIRQNVILFYKDFSDKKIESTVDLPNKDIYAMGNKKAVDRILNNLISNAIKYGHEGKIIGVNLKCNEENIQVVVWDKGRGIPKEDIDLIFKRLYTLGKSRNLSLQGSGLGLTIVKKLVKMQGGTIDVRSTPYKKTEFIFTLPGI